MQTGHGSIDENAESVGAILLAAGSAARFGGKKLLADFNGPLVAGAARNARQAGLPLLAVVAPGEDAVASAIGSPATLVVAPEAHLGLSRSLAAGLSAAPAGWRAALILLGDMPCIQPSTLRLIAEHAGRADSIVTVEHGGRRGNPVAWGRDHWPMLTAVTGDRGGGALLDQLAARVTRLSVDDPGILIDVDTAADLETLRSRSGVSASAG